MNNNHRSTHAAATSNDSQFGEWAGIPSPRRSGDREGGSADVARVQKSGSATRSDCDWLQSRARTVGIGGHRPWGRIPMPEVLGTAREADFYLYGSPDFFSHGK
jgi:hypothetical protein